MSLLRRIANLFSRDNLTREIDAEFESHLRMRIEDNLAAGMSPKDARRDALLRFGNRTATREHVTAADSSLIFASIGSDIRFALRQLRQNPGFASTAVLVLALGLGAGIAIFAFVDAALIKPLPYRDPSRIAALFESMSLGARYHISYLDYLDWKRMNQVFSSLEVYDDDGFSLATPGGPQIIDGAMVSDGFFRTLGVKPALGRDFRTGEDLPGSAHIVLLSDEVWRNRYGARADIIGQSVSLNGIANTVVGVLPADFHFAPLAAAGYWIPLSVSPGCLHERGCHSFSGLARLRDGITFQAAAANMKQIADQLARQYPDADAERGATVLPLSEIIVGSLRPILLVLLAGALVLLLIACANVASLLLVRAESRKREIAVRGALGASPARLIRQLITEGLVLVSVASFLGIGAAAVAMRLLLGLIPRGMLEGMPYLIGLGTNGRVAVFALLLALLSALLFSLLPALHLSRAGAGSAMRDTLTAGGRSFAGTLWRRFGANLIVLELAAAVVLLVCAGLLARSFYRLLRAPIGLDPDHLVALRVTAPDRAYTDPGAMDALERQLVARAAALPGVKSSGAATVLPIGNHGGSTTFYVVGRPQHGERVEVIDRTVDQNYFPVVGARLLRGRNFTADDDATHPRVMIINRSMATIHFPAEDPIGKQIKYDATSPPVRIVGIVDDIQEGPLDVVNGPSFYTPFAQSDDHRFFLVARASVAERPLLASLTAAIREADPRLITSQPTVMTERIHDSPAAYLHRSSAWLTSGFAALALLLGVVGLYGVIAYSVSQRTREIGVRMALGARRETVCSLILREAAWLTAIGIAAGLACSIAAAMLMRKLLFGIQPWDAPTLAAVATLLAVFAMLASYIPARRAASVNPVDALRAD